MKLPPAIRCRTMLSRQKTFLAGKRGRFVRLVCALLFLLLGSSLFLSLATVRPFNGFHRALELARWPCHVGHQHSTGQGGLPCSTRGLNMLPK